MGLIPEELTCEEKAEKALAEAQELFECLIEGGAGGDLSQFLRLFFAPDFAMDGGQLAWQNLMFLTCREPCGPAVGNNAETKCISTCSGDCDGCCDSVEIKTGCDDPEQCDTFAVGWNYTALARAAEHAVSLEYLPVALNDLQNGDVMVWDPSAIPQNKHCDPCKPEEYGAWVNSSSLGGINQRVGGGRGADASDAVIVNDAGPHASQHRSIVEDATATDSAAPDGKLASVDIPPLVVTNPSPDLSMDYTLGFHVDWSVTGAGKEGVSLTNQADSTAGGYFAELLVDGSSAWGVNPKTHTNMFAYSLTPGERTLGSYDNTLVGTIPPGGSVTIAMSAGVRAQAGSFDADSCVASWRLLGVTTGV